MPLGPFSFGLNHHRAFRLGPLVPGPCVFMRFSQGTSTQHPSSGNLTSLAEYVERMKDKQEAIYYIAGGSKEEVSSSPFFENHLKKGYELLLLTEAMDEYAISSLPEFEGKKFQNVAKEGFNLDGDTEASRERREAVKEKFDSLTKWLGEDALKDNILRAEVSERLVDSPCALVTSK